ncbi:MAG: hypothetical protein Q8O19_02025, partial [Rectinemataceae bacterium]|nr:hypothetical protein [Rectinemataceae bacterium]
RLARDRGDYKGMLAANDQLIELGGYYRKSVEVKGDLTVNTPISETAKLVADMLAKVRGNRKACKELARLAGGGTR